MLRYIHGSTFYLFFVLPKMEAPNFESIFECMGSIKFLFLFILNKEVYKKVSSYLPVCNVLVAPPSILHVIVDVQVSSACPDNDDVKQSMHIIYENCQGIILYVNININDTYESDAPM